MTVITRKRSFLVPASSKLNAANTLSIGTIAGEIYFVVARVMGANTFSTGFSFLCTRDFHRVTVLATVTVTPRLRPRHEKHRRARRLRNENRNDHPGNEYTIPTICWSPRSLSDLAERFIDQTSNTASLVGFQWSIKQDYAQSR